MHTVGIEEYLHSCLTSGHFTPAKVPSYLWHRFLYEKPTGPLLVKKFTAFYGTLKVITDFTGTKLPVPILSPINAVYAPSHSLNIHFNIILQTMPRFPKCSLLLKFSHQKLCIHFSCLPYMLHAPPISFFLI